MKNLERLQNERYSFNKRFRSLMYKTCADSTVVVFWILGIFHTGLSRYI